MKICQKCKGSGNKFVSVRPFIIKPCNKCGGKGLKHIPEGWIRNHTIMTKVKDNTNKNATLNFDFEEWKDKTMAHIMVESGIFKGVNEAKKNGWNKPVEKGEFFLKKRRTTIVIG